MTWLSLSLFSFLVGLARNEGCLVLSCSFLTKFIHKNPTYNIVIIKIHVESSHPKRCGRTSARHSGSTTRRATAKPILFNRMAMLSPWSQEAACPSLRHRHNRKTRIKRNKFNRMRGLLLRGSHTGRIPSSKCGQRSPRGALLSRLSHCVAWCDARIVAFSVHLVMLSLGCVGLLRKLAFCHMSSFH